MREHYDWKDNARGRHDYRQNSTAIQQGWFEETEPWTLDRFVIYRVWHDNPSEYNRPMMFVPTGHVVVAAMRASDGVSMYAEMLTLDEYAKLTPLHNNGPPLVFPAGYTPQTTDWRMHLPADHRWRELWPYLWENPANKLEE